MNNLNPLYPLYPLYPLHPLDTVSGLSAPYRSRDVVVIPTYEEADNIVTVLDRVRAAAPHVHVAVVDDRSPDGTGDLVRAYACRHPGVALVDGGAKQGLGAAYRTGFRWALEHGFDAVVQMDADLSHPPEMIPVLLAALDTADVAIGSRYVPGGSVSHWPLHRRLVSRAGNAYVRLVLDLPTHDATSGFRAFRRQALIDLDVVGSRSDGYCFQIETTWQAARRGVVTTEVPIEFVDREHGASKMESRIAVEALRRVARWRWDELTADLLHPSTGRSRSGHVAA